MRTLLIATTLLTCGLLLGGCPDENLNDDAGVTLFDVNLIRNDDGLTVQQQREELVALGLTPRIVNALLQDERLGNQYGGDLRSAYEKIAGDDFTALTPDEVQIYVDAASAADEDDELDVELADDEAQTIVSFLTANNLNSSEELAEYLDDSGGSVPANIPDDVLELAFIEFDPDLLLPELP